MKIDPYYQRQIIFIFVYRIRYSNNNINSRMKECMVRLDEQFFSGAVYIFFLQRWLSLLRKTGPYAYMGILQVLLYNRVILAGVNGCICIDTSSEFTG